MAYKYEIEYTAIGMWPHRYSGRLKEFWSNYADLDAVREQARQKVARDGCFSPHNVEIKSVRRAD